MPKKKNGKKTSKKVGAKPIAKKSKEPFTLSLQTRRGIWTVFWLVLALITLLSLFEFAGALGAAWRRLLSFFFGLGTLIMPIVFVVAGILVLRGKKFTHAKSRIIGLVILVLALLGIFHIWTSLDDMVPYATAGQGGGWGGLLLAYPLKLGLGFWAGLIVLLAIVTVGLLLLFDAGLLNFWPWRKDDKEIERRPTPGEQEDVTVHGMNDQADKKNKQKIKLSAKLFKKKPIPAADPDQATVGGDAATMPPESKDKNDEQDKEGEAGEPEINVRNMPGEFSKGVALQVKDMDYEAPPLDLLESKVGKPSSGDIKQNVLKIRRTLENFGIPVEMGDVSVGPTVTQYTFKPAEGIKLSAITGLQNDLALALAAHPVRIEAPIPGKSLVGLEVPNISAALVRLREILSSDPYRDSKSKLPIALGRDVAGNPTVASLDTMPHLLIAGSTGSGKSVAINSILLSLLYKNSPQSLKLIMVDPKRVELTAYDGIPHLITPVVTEVKKAIPALRWAVAEMDKRYELLNSAGKRNIETYNNYVQGQKMPYIAIIIDELADLMSVAARDVEAAIVRLAQMARAVGIHLIVATQRPSVDVITGLIKANITTRIAFNVASSIDSRTILDHSGAEKLLGNGDMLYITASLSKPKRIQGSFVTEKEVEAVTGYIKEKAGLPDYVETISRGQPDAGSTSGRILGGDSKESDPLLAEAKQVIIENKKASASLLQRRLSVGYARAARLLDLMEEKGWIGPGQGAKPREIFIGSNEEQVRAKEASGQARLSAPADNLGQGGISHNEDIPPVPRDNDEPPPPGAEF